MVQVVEAGQQRVELGDDGIVVMRISGTIRAEEAVIFDRALREYQDRHKDTVLFVDFTHGSGIDANARRTIIDGVNAKPYAVAFIKASFAVRALVGLMLNASKVLGRNYPHAFVDSEEEGRRWAATLKGGWGV